MTTQLLIRIDADVKHKVDKLAKMEGQTTSGIVRQMIEEYVRERDISTHIDDLWSRIGGALKSKGAGPKKVHGAIRSYRAGKKA